MGILIRGYAFDRSQRLHVVRRNRSSPPLCLCLSTAPFASHPSCTAALQLFRRRLHLPVRKEKSRPRVVANCMLRKNTGASSACEETHSVFSHFFLSLQSPPAVSTGCTSCVGAIRSSSRPAALLSLPEEERNGTPASTGRIGRLLHDSFLQILLQICPYLLRSPFRSHFGHIAVHHQVDKLFKAGTVRIPSEFSLRLRRVAP